MYSRALVRIVDEYRKAFPWVFQALEASKDGEMRSLTPADMLPDLDPDQRRAQVDAAVKWLKASPIGKRPLVKDSVQMCTDEAVERLQMALTPLPGRGGASAPLELECVPPALLLPPYDPAQAASAVAGGEFELGDRVVVLRGTGSPPFGARGTVIGVHEDACELLFDEDFAGEA